MPRPVHCSLVLLIAALAAACSDGADDRSSSSTSTASTAVSSSDTTTTTVEGVTLPPGTTALDLLFVVARPGGRDIVLLAGGEATTVAEFDDTGSLLSPGLLDWSADGTRALVAVSTAPSYEAQIHELDLRTGQMTMVADGVHPASYTRPTGENLVVVDWDDPPSGAYRIQRWSRDGNVLAEIGAGTGEPSWLYAPDGTSVVLGAEAGIEVRRIDGTLLRRLDAGGLRCDPARWWSNDEVLAACGPAGNAIAPNANYHQLWVLPLDGSPGRSVTPIEPIDPVVDFGYVDAMRLGDGTVVQWSGDCGESSLRWMGSDGDLTRIQIPGSLGKDVLVAVDAGRAIVRSSLTCDHADGWLATVDPLSGAAEMLWAPPPGTDGVVDVLARTPTASA